MLLALDNPVYALIWLLLVGMVYFLPTIIASLRDINGVIGVFILNLFFGWTIIVWFIVLFVSLWQHSGLDARIRWPR